MIMTGISALVLLAASAGGDTAVAMSAEAVAATAAADFGAYRALLPETCQAINQMLSDRESDGFMWKTGTSSSHRDAWAIGQDGQLAIGVWIGRFSGSGRASYTGATAAEPLLWRLRDRLAGV